MKNKLSLFTCLLVGIVLGLHRIAYPLGDAKLKVTDWDALGYYFYLPALLIYDDISELKWFPGIDRKYAVSGGTLYQANRQDDSNRKYVGKYLGGVAILQIPLFTIGHIIANAAGYPADGFSAPYQYAIAWGALLYCFLALLLLRRILLRYFSDHTVAITLLLLCLASNFIQYAAVDGGMSHAYIFPLYVLILWFTIKWHSRPGMITAAAIGYIIGLATISRPTELIMVLIPLLWGTQDKEAATTKWQLVKDNRSHIFITVLFGFIGVLPQLLYWKSVTGHFVYDVGSSWRFLSPFFRVLIGWEKGWFIYTPVAILFVAGFFFIKKYDFRKSVLWFCILNIYIVISWADWKYGGSYSTRALVQSYPVFALAFAALLERLRQYKWYPLVYLLGVYLVAVNIFQVWQYNMGIIGDMTFQTYKDAYLDITSFVK